MSVIIHRKCQGSFSNLQLLIHQLTAFASSNLAAQNAGLPLMSSALVCATWSECFLASATCCAHLLMPITNSCSDSVPSTLRSNSRSHVSTWVSAGTHLCPPPQLLHNHQDSLIDISVTNYSARSKIHPSLMGIRYPVEVICMLQ